MTQIRYLGHIISISDIQLDPEKTTNIKNYPTPKNVKDIQKFIGLTGYCRKFVPHYLNLITPLTQLFHKNTIFIWKEEQTKSLSKLINILSFILVLQYPNFSFPFYLYTDASNTAVGAILQQRNEENNFQPIVYVNRTLNKAELNYVIIEKETLVVVWAVHYFRPYLFGQSFKILFDHKTLQLLFRVINPDSRLLRWRIKLEATITK